MRSEQEFLEEMLDLMQHGRSLAEEERKTAGEKDTFHYAWWSGHETVLEIFEGDVKRRLEEIKNA